MKIMLVPALSACLAGCVASGARAPQAIQASAGDAELRWMIAATVASTPYFGGWSIIGAPSFTRAGISGPMLASPLFGGPMEEYCVSATMTVAGIPQPKSAYVRIQRGASVATASVRPANCTGLSPFPELEMVAAKR